MAIHITTTTMDNFFVLILAGGKSSRMGEDKKYLHLGNQTLLEKSYQLALELVDGDRSKVLISGDIPGWTSIKDIVPGRGPIGGLWSVAKYLLDNNSPGFSCNLLLMPVDMPLLTINSLKILKEHSYSKQLVKFEGFQMPFVFNLNLKSISLLQKMVESEIIRECSVSFFQREMTGTEISLPTSDNCEFLNANTPADWSEIISKMRKENELEAR